MLLKWKTAHVAVKLFLPILCLVMLFGCQTEDKSALVQNKKAALDTLQEQTHEEAVQEPLFEKSEIPEEIREKMMNVTINENSRMNFDTLSYLSLTCIGYDEKEYVGHMIVDAQLADEVICIFKELYEARFPVEKMKPVCEYAGSDDLSMQDNNTSSFNDRPATGGSGLSYHQLGRAIDINPLVNPYVKKSKVLPASSTAYTDRTLGAKGMITQDGKCVEIFKKYGWSWGGDWKSLKDYQHFEKR